MSYHAEGTSSERRLLATEEPLRRARCAAVSFVSPNARSHTPAPVPVEAHTKPRFAFSLQTVEDKLRAREENPDEDVEAAAAAREVTVSFNADVNDNMPWKFQPTQRSIKVGAQAHCISSLRCSAPHCCSFHVELVQLTLPVQSLSQLRPGQSTLAFYTAENTSDRVITGVSTYNVTPQQAGTYFNKIQCFCFEVRLTRRGSLTTDSRAFTATYMRLPMSLLVCFKQPSLQDSQPAASSCGGFPSTSIEPRREVSLRGCVPDVMHVCPPCRSKSCGPAKKSTCPSSSTWILSLQQTLGCAKSTI